MGSPEKRMRLADLYCGAGGFSRGAHDAGFDVVSAYDLDPILTSSYERNFPRTKLHLKDVSKLSGAEVVRDAGGAIDGIFGGPPCQGFSEIGLRNEADPRRALVGHFFRIVAEARPSFFVMENVRGLATKANSQVLKGAMASVLDGYDVLGPRIWDASAFGAATRRPRMFVIGVRKDHGAPVAIEDVEAERAAPATVRNALADLEGATHTRDDDDGFDVWRTKAVGRPNGYAASLRAPDREFTGHRPTVHSDVVRNRYAGVPQGGIDKVGRHVRLDWTGQCPTLRAGTGSDRGSFQSVRPLHPVQNRVITVREAARLQGFPDSHIFHPTVWHSFRMIGNSVSPIISAAIFRAIAKRLAQAQGEPLLIAAE